MNIEEDDLFDLHWIAAVIGDLRLADGVLPVTLNFDSRNIRAIDQWHDFRRRIKK